MWCEAEHCPDYSVRQQLTTNHPVRVRQGMLDILAAVSGLPTAIIEADACIASPQLLATGPSTPEVLSELTGYEGFAASSIDFRLSRK